MHSKEEQDIIHDALTSEWHGLFRRAKASNKRIIVGLRREQFDSMKVVSCFYCGHNGGKPILRPETGEVVTRYRGIDRLNSHKSYTRSNSVPCCSICNYAKNDMSPKGFIKWIENLKENPLDSYNEPDLRDKADLENPGFKKILSRYKGSAQKRGYEFTLTPEQALAFMQAPCAYCNQGKKNKCKLNKLDSFTLG